MTGETRTPPALREMLTDQMGCAISTTGDEHRMRFLETSVRKWWEALPWGSPLFVTVDGDEQAFARVVEAVKSQAVVLRVGQPESITRAHEVREGRLGVAVNKNTGIEVLMDYCGDHGYPTVEHLFLSDDDTSPKSLDSLKLHTDSSDALPHSMVCWGRKRHPVQFTIGGGWSAAHWSWPRGVMLYTRRSVVSAVGGMDERFGPGGHEHAEWSRRIHQAGFTPYSFCTPVQYALGARGMGEGTGAAGWWDAEDMPRRGESQVAFNYRKGRQTSVRTADRDWDRIRAIMDERDGDTSFVPFRSTANGRSPATMSENLSRGASSEQ